MGRYKKPSNKMFPPKPKSLRCPAWMCDDGRELWRKLGPELVRQGVITVLDKTAFEMLCQTYGLMKKAERELLEIKSLAISNGRKDSAKKHPLVAVYRGFSTQFRVLSADFGLTPTSRGRVNVDSSSFTEDPGGEFFETSPNVRDIRQAKK